MLKGLARQWSPIFLLVAVTSGLALTLYEAHLDTKPVVEYQKSPGDWLLARTLRGSTFSLERMREANTEYELIASNARTRSSGSPAWSFVGPVNIGGRVLDIAMDPNVANTLYVASASGGVWKSTDAGATFTSIWPADNDQSIGALATS